ncbi:TPA: hypothetical protein R0E49_000658 [Clostridioides difficile]|nr:hypothetical protein [Clostridioides difficile]
MKKQIYSIVALFSIPIMLIGAFIIDKMFFLFLLFVIFVVIRVYNIGSVRINDFLIERKCKLCQSISFKMYIRLLSKNNFKNNKPSRGIRKEIVSKGLDSFEQYLKRCEHETLTTTTNGIMEKLIYKMEKKKIIKVEIIENSKKEIYQITAKLFLMGLCTTIINITNKEYWKYVFRKETINEYRLIIVKNNQMDVSDMKYKYELFYTSHKGKLSKEEKIKRVNTLRIKREEIQMNRSLIDNNEERALATVMLTLLLVVMNIGTFFINFTQWNGSDKVENKFTGSLVDKSYIINSLVEIIGIAMLIFAYMAIKEFSKINKKEKKMKKIIIKEKQNINIISVLENVYIDLLLEEDNYNI